jgi:hypothetical protein
MSPRTAKVERQLSALLGHSAFAPGTALLCPLTAVARAREQRRGLVDLSRPIVVTRLADDVIE